jgi:predicted secreted protein with PEFG-CTERM motif
MVTLMKNKLLVFAIMALTIGMVSAYGQTPTTNTVKVQNTDYSISYQITNGQVTNVTALPAAKSLIILASGTGNSVLTVTLPRDLIDAKTGNQDTTFSVSDDGISAKFQESKTDMNRTLTIPFTYSTNPETIQIMGTQVVPEFGVVASLVLVVSIISIIIVSAKTKLRFLPRY